MPLPRLATLMVIDTSAIVAIALNDPGAVNVEQRIVDDPGLRCLVTDRKKRSDLIKLTAFGSVTPREASNQEWSADYRLHVHCGLNSDIAPHTRSEQHHHHLIKRTRKVSSSDPKGTRPLRC
jgi:hypothetical protein